MISIIVPSIGRKAEVKTLCESISRQSLNEDYEVFIVCNPPSAAVKELLEDYPGNFRYLDTKILGANSARNCGVRAARGRYLFFFDDDCEIPDTKFLQKRIELLDQNQHLDGCGGGYQPKKMKSAYATVYFFLQQKWLLEGRTEQGLQKYLIGGNMVLRRELFERQGLFTEKLIFGGTETEFFSRQPDSKFLFIPHSEVYHSYDIGLFDFIRKAFMQGVGKSFIEQAGQRDKGPRLRYGDLAVAKLLGLGKVSGFFTAVYDLAFRSGDLFHQTTKRAKPSKAEIFIYIAKTWWAKRRIREAATRGLCLLDNYKFLYHLTKHDHLK